MVDRYSVSLGLFFVVGGWWFVVFVHLLACGFLIGGGCCVGVGLNGGGISDLHAVQILFYLAPHEGKIFVPSTHCCLVLSTILCSSHPIYVLNSLF